MTKFFLLALSLIAAATAWAWSRHLAKQKVREVARLLEAELERLAEKERKAEEKAKAKAEEKQKARVTAEIKAEEARLKAEAGANRLADDVAIAEGQAWQEARLKAEAETKAMAEALAVEERQAEEKARAEAEALERARLAVEAEAQRFPEQTADTEATESQSAEETKPDFAPESKPRDYRPLAPVSQTAQPRPNRTRTNRQPRDTSLELRLQIDFGRDGGVKTLSLVPERREGMPSQIEIDGERLNGWNDNYYDAVPVEDMGEHLAQNVKWRGRDGTQSWRWILTRRQLHVLASGDVCGLYQFGSVHGCCSTPITLF